MRYLYVVFTILLLPFSQGRASDESFEDEMDFEYQTVVPAMVQMVASFIEHATFSQTQSPAQKSMCDPRWLMTYFNRALDADMPILEALYLTCFGGLNVVEEKTFYKYLHENPDVELDIQPELRCVLGHISNFIYKEKYFLSDRNLSVLPAHMNIFKRLENLNISHNDLRDISPLVQLQNLQNLDISFNPIQDFTPLLSLGNLKGLEMNKMGGSRDFRFLAKMTQLEKLSVACNAMNGSGFWFLRTLTKLQSLNVSYTLFSCSYDLSNCKALEFLAIDSTCIRRVGCLPYFANLQYIDMRSTSLVETPRMRQYVARRFSPTVALQMDDGLIDGTYGYFSWLGDIRDLFPRGEQLSADYLFESMINLVLPKF